MYGNSIEYDYSELKGRIASKIGTRGDFARLIGRTPQFVSMVLNGKAYFNDKDIMASIEVLELEPSEVGVLFYTQKVHKCE